MEHPFRFDDRGFVKMVDTAGHVTTLAGEYWAEEGLAWSPDGTAVFFSASISGPEGYQPLAVTTMGRPVVRVALSSMGIVYMQDVARDGRWLVARHDPLASIRALVPGQTDEREFPWLNNAVNPFLSPDGRMLLFQDLSQSAGPTYAVAMRKTDGSPAVRLGEGAAMGSHRTGSGPWHMRPRRSWCSIPRTRRCRQARSCHSGVWICAGFRTASGSSHAGMNRPRATMLCAGCGRWPPKPVTPDGPIFALVAPDNRLCSRLFRWIDPYPASRWRSASIGAEPRDNGPCRGVEPRRNGPVRSDWRPAGET